MNTPDSKRRRPARIPALRLGARALAATTLAAAALNSLGAAEPADGDTAVIRIGMIGLDTSHVTAFTARLNEPDNKNHVPGGKVVAAVVGGSPDIPSSRDRVGGYTKTLTEKYGVVLYDTVEELCRHVDAVMLESVDGRPHLVQALPVIEAGLPLFIDKPVAGSLRDAFTIYKAARRRGVPVFSTSSLRYYPGVVEVAQADVGEVRGAISYGPAHKEPHHPDLFWYGIHPTESLFTVLGPGCQTVVRTATPHTDVVTGVWAEGKVGTLRGLRDARTAYKVTVFGTKGIFEQRSGGDYTPMIREIMRFFRTGKPPVPPEVTLEIYAFMEAADESKRRGGVPVQIADVIRANGGPLE